MKQRISVAVGLLCFVALFFIAPERYGQKPKDAGLAVGQPVSSPPVERPSRSLTPSFSSEVPLDVQKAMIELLDAYARGDGKAAYARFSTDREEGRIIEAFAAVQIPIMEPKVSMAGAERIKIEYKMPHPGNIIRVIARAQTVENTAALRQGMSALRSEPDILTQTEAWAIDREGGRIRFNYGRKGILCLADLYGTSVCHYAADTADAQRRQLWESPLGNSLVMNFGPLAMMADYSLCFGLETGSPEMAAMTKEILSRIDKEITARDYSLQLPYLWQNMTEPDEEREGTVSYAGRLSSGGIMVFRVVRDNPAEKTVSQLRDLNVKTDSEILSFALTINRHTISMNAEIGEIGDVQIGDVPAKSISLTRQPKGGYGKPNKKGQWYIAVKDRVVYTLIFECDEPDFNSSLDLIGRIKASFRFRELPTLGEMIDAVEGGEGSTTIPGAVSNGRPGRVKLLIEQGQDVNQKDQFGKTALHWVAEIIPKEYFGITQPGALESDYAEVTLLLIKSGADVNAGDNFNQTPLHLAAGEGNGEIASLLLANGAKVNALSHDGSTPLHIAAYANKPAIVQLLIGKGADVAVKDAEGKTALDVARMKNNQAVIDLLEPFQTKRR